MKKINRKLTVFMAFTLFIAGSIMGQAPDLFISEYIEGSSFNKALEIYNGTGSSVSLDGYFLIKVGNPSGTETWADGTVYSFTSGASIANDDVYVVYNSSAGTGISSVGDETNGACTFNGDDPVALIKDENTNGVYDDGTDQVLDAIGDFTGSDWGKDLTWVRKASYDGNSTFTLAEWDEYSQDEFNYLGTHAYSSGTTTLVQFSSSSATVGEGDGTYDLTLSITNEDGTNPTECEVALTTGDAADVDNYTTQTVTFPAGSSTDETITLTITDDTEYEGDETLTFSIQNVTGGDGATAGSPSDFDLTITDNDPAVELLPYSRDFETGDLYTDGWTTQVITGSLDWEYAEYSGDHFAEMSNYDGGNSASETWLITPGIDLSGATNPIFGFYNACNHSGADIEVYISTDYDGTSNPNTGFTWNTLSPTLSGGSYNDVYSGDLDISSYTGGTAFIAFKYTGTDSDGKTWQIDDITIEDDVLLAEPTNHVASFTATTNGHNQVDLTWTDNDGTQPAENFLIKASTTDYADITAPVDGTEEADDTDLSDGNGVVNVAHGVEAYNWTGLAETTTYYFKIYPYTNTGVDIDYKTDGTVPQADATTDAAPAVPDLIISEVTDPGDDYDARYVELYNSGATTIDFSNTTVYFDRQANGGNHSSTQLTGWVEPGATYTIAKNGSYFYTVYGFYPDLDFGSVNGNGDDGYFLYVGGDETSGTLFDAYGVVDVDGTGEAWEYEDSRAVRNSSVTAPNATWTAGEWTITAGVNVADMTPNAHVDNTTFAGTTDADWHTAANWTGGVVPTASSIVTIPTTSSLTISAAADCGSLYIKSDTSGTGSIIGSEYITTKATGTVEQYLTTNTTTPNWHYLSIPVGAETADAFPGYSGTFAYYWTEGWEDWLSGEITNGTTALSVMTGYAVPSDGDVKAVFEGTFNDTELGLTDISYNGGTFVGYHLIGNPYPSPIDLDQLTTTTTNTTGDVWFRVDGTFAVYSINTHTGQGGATQYAPGNQGFWMKVTSGTNEITFPLDMRTHTTHDFYKEAENNVFRMAAEKDGYTDEVVVGFYDNANNDFENFDSEKRFAEANEYPQLYSVVDGYKLAINALNTDTDAYTVPVGFKANVAGTYNLTATNMDEFNCKANVYLKDNVTGDMVDLRKNNSYQVNITSAGDDPSRFSLIFSSSPTSIEDVAGNAMKVFANNNTLFINSSIRGNAMVEVFDVTGKNVYTENMEFNTGLQQINLNNEAGVYVVRISMNDQIVNKKVVIQ